MTSAVRQRKPGKQQAEAAAPAKPPAKAAAAPAARAKRGTGQRPPAGAAREPPAALQGAAALLALVALAYCHHAAVRLLAPQTGEWLAATFCSLAMLAPALVAAVAGCTVEEARPALGGPQVTAAGAAGAWGWWLSAAAAVAVALVHPERLAGRLLLSPGLAGSSGARVTDTEVTLRSMAVAAAAFGPLFVSLGLAAASCGARAMRRAGLPLRPLLLVPLLLVAAAGASLACGLPDTLLPPWPGVTIPPAVAAAGALLAAALSPRRGGRRWLAAAALVGAAAVLLAAVARQPCGDVSLPLEGGRYRVLWRCQAAAGAQLSAVEGTYKDKYRYRLLRLDHSVMGGEYLSPDDVAGQSIYTAFYLQQAAVLLRPNGTRSLHVGLGVGTAAKAMQRLGVAADSIELHPEVIHAAQRFFGLRPGAHGGRVLAGDAARLVPQLAAAVRAGEAAPYDYVLHDVFSGGGAAGHLMGEAFFRQLGGVLAPGGVAAVNYFGGRGQGLKQAWCRLRLVFDSVRAFSDIENSRARNHVLFASDSDLAAADLAAAAAALEADSAEAAQRSGGREEPVDPLQLRLWRSLQGQEVKLTYDRPRCEQMLRHHSGLPSRPSGSGGGSGSGGKSFTGSAGRHREGQQGGRALPPAPWVWRQVRNMRERHALALQHWVAMRTQFSDAFWQA